jgi:hypothetical protein
MCFEIRNMKYAIQMVSLSFGVVNSLLLCMEITNNDFVCLKMHFACSIYIADMKLRMAI